MKYSRISGVIVCLLVLVSVVVIGMQGDKHEENVTQSVLVNDAKAERGVSVNTVSGNTVSANTVSANTVSANTVSANTVSDNDAESEYINFAIADVNHYVNVRNQPSTEGDIIGKIYDGAVAEVLAIAGEENDWFQITSGNVEGYIKAEFFIYGEEAAAVMDEYITRYAQVQVERLNVRAGQSTDNKRIGYIDRDEKVKLLED